jgi:hypothetical protein
MVKVYVFESGLIPFEGGGVMGIYSTLEKAKECLPGVTWHEDSNGWFVGQGTAAITAFVLDERQPEPTTLSEAVLDASQEEANGR